MAKDKIFSALGQKLCKQWKSENSGTKRHRLRAAMIENSRAWRDWFQSQVVFNKTRVYLTAEAGFAPSALNPIIGSEFECLGTIIAMTAEHEGIYLFYLVKWDNGSTKHYRFSDLRIYGGEELIEKPPLPDNPNKAFAQEKRKVYRHGWRPRPLKDDF